MTRDEGQDMLNVLKYNQDRMNKIIEKTSKAIEDMEKVHQEVEYEEDDFLEVDLQIAKSLDLLKKYNISKL